MPIYFNDIAPFCPVSRDQPTGPALSKAPNIRTVIPRAHDLSSAIAAANIARSIITQIVTDKVINNVFSPPSLPSRSSPGDKITDMRRHSRWSEVKSARVKRKYKYYGKDENGDKDKDTWVLTERIERMVWRDSGWKTSMEFVYGDKGEGESDGGSNVPGGDAGGEL